MKFIKYAVGLVIALSVIPLVVVTVNNLDQPKVTTVEFEVIEYDTETGQFTFSDNVYNKLLLYSKVESNIVTNLISVKLNDIDPPSFTLNLGYNNDFSYVDGNDNDWEELKDNTDKGISAGYTPTIGDKWEMTFEVPSPTPPLVKLLVGFAPLLFVGGILLFMLNKRKLA